ncbi:MAG: hypothetical protein Q9181_003011 [Wetmoreana brouardii]
MEAQECLVIELFAKFLSPRMSEQTLSRRGQENLPAGVSFAKLVEVLTDGYDKNENPNGIISLGVAENGLMHKELASYFNKLEITPKHLTYGDGPFGSRALRSALSDFFNDYFKPVQKVLPEQLLAVGGVTSAIDLIAWATADEGDGILIGRPLYSSFAKDVNTRAGTILCPVSSGGGDPMSERMVGQFEKELLEQEKRGRKTRGLILASPHNPLGKCYTVDTLKAYMRFCQKHRIHLISDEVYAMSVYKTPDNTNAVPFTSVLSIDTANLIDSNLVHVLYGMSKDFSSNGLRSGVLLSQANPSLLQTLKSVAMYTWPTSTTEHCWTTLLNDRPFLDYYLEENRKRLADGYARVTEWLREQNIKWVEGSNAGFFLWADFRGVLGKEIIVDEGKDEEVEAVAVERPSQVYRTSRRAKERDDWFFAKMIKAKVFVASGDAFFAEEHGWYRVSFSVPKEVLELGLERLGRVLEEVRRESGGA